MNREELNEIKRIMAYKTAEGGKVTEIYNLYRKFINPAFNGCTTCSDVIRTAFATLKDWYRNNLPNLEANVAHLEQMELLKKNITPVEEVDVLPVKEESKVEPKVEEVKKDFNLIEEINTDILEDLNSKGEIKKVDKKKSIFNRKNKKKTKKKK